MLEPDVTFSVAETSREVSNSKESSNQRSGGGRP